MNLPAKLDIKQVIVPEFLIKHLSFVNGDQLMELLSTLPNMLRRIKHLSSLM
jgi:hypothetical protein